MSSRLREATAAATRVGPHQGAHRVALRAGVSVLVPLLLLTATGHVGWTVFAAFGAFASLYGRGHSFAERAGMQLVVGGVLSACVVGGVAVSLLPGARWWTVGLGSVVAAGGALLSETLRWHPPGPLFLVFAFTVCASIPATGATLLVAVLVALGSAVFAVLVGSVRPRRGGLPRPVFPTPDLRATLDRPGLGLHLLRYLLAPALAGALSTSFGWGHTYWAMVAAVVPMAAVDVTGRVVRGVQRLVGTAVGLGVAAALLAGHPAGVVVVLLVAALQVCAELTIGRNYALALVFVTPLALLVGQLARPQTAGALLSDRALDTALGVVVAVVITLLTSDRTPGPGAGWEARPS